MPKRSDVSNVTRREFLVAAGTIATTGYLVIGASSRAAAEPSSPAAAAKHLMTFDVSSGSIACLVDSQPSTTCTLTAAPNDLVNFKAITGPKGKRHLAVLFIDRTPFVDTDGNAVWAFHGSEADEANGIGGLASIASNLSYGDLFEFSVGVWDEANANRPKSYTSDPTIIIGKGGPALASTIAKLSAADGLLLKAERDNPMERDDINTIEVQLASLIAKLKESLTKTQGQSK